MRAGWWWVRWRWCWRSWFSDRRGTDTDGTVERMGTHPGGVPPRPGGAGDGGDSQVERERDQAARGTGGGGHLPALAGDRLQFRLRPGVGLSVRSQSFLDQRDQRQLPRRHRWDQPPSPDPLDLHRGPVGDLLVEPLGGAPQSQGLPDPDADPGHRDERHFCRPRSGALLHLLRGGPAPDVLHDRDLGRQDRPQDSRASARETETRLYAAIKFFLFTLFGSAFMLLGFLAVYFRSGLAGSGRSTSPN